MKRILWLCIIAIWVAVPAFAAVEEDDIPELGDSLAGGPNTDFINAGPKVDPLIDIRNWLGRAGAPAMEKKQEKPLKTLYNKELDALAKPFQARFGVTLRTALASQSTASSKMRGATKANSELTVEVRRISNLLSDKLIAALRMDQQIPLRKYQSEQVRLKKIELLHQTLAASGISLSEQLQNEIQAAYARESYLRTLAIIEARGESYQGVIAAIANQTTQKVAQILEKSSRSVVSAGTTPKSLQ